MLLTRLMFLPHPNGLLFREPRLIHLCLHSTTNSTGF
jgi:hypothetical protein